MDVKNLAIYWDTERLEEYEGEELIVCAASGWGSIKEGIF